LLALGPDVSASSKALGSEDRRFEEVRARKGKVGCREREKEEREKDERERETRERGIRDDEEKGAQQVRVQYVQGRPIMQCPYCV
jgi:hypothetical protein